MRLALTRALRFGFTPAHGFANALAAILLTPALGRSAPCRSWMQPGPALGRDAAERWSRIMVEAGAALIIACLATVISAALWPGVTFLALVTGPGVWRWLSALATGRACGGEPSGLRCSCSCSTIGPSTARIIRQPRSAVRKPSGLARRGAHAGDLTDARAMRRA